MSFIVSYNGQFKPFKLPDLSYFDRVHKVYKPAKDNKVSSDEKSEFSEVLANQNHHSKKAIDIKHINQYAKIEKEHHSKKKMYFARDIMSKLPHCLDENTSLSKILEEGKKYKFKHFPILNAEGVLSGILSDRDLLIHLHKDHSKIKAKDIMTREVLTALESTRIQQIAQIMLHENIHCLPIIDDNYKLTGILTQTDILDFITRLSPTEIWG